MKLTVEPWQEIIYRNAAGREVKPICTCPNTIPGLDAIGCRNCKVWWIDQEMRDRLVPPRKSKKSENQYSQEGL